MKKSLLFLLLILGSVSCYHTQTSFGLKLSEISNDGNDYVVKLEIQMYGNDPSVFKLGTTSLQFGFPNAAISNPVVVSFDPLTAPFYIQPFASVPLAGQCSYNIELAAANYGATIAAAPAWTEVGQISFTIDDEALLEDLSWTYNGGTTGTVLFLDDEATQIFVETPESSNLLFVPLESSNVRFTMINPNNNQITIKNFGDLTEDISSWRLCSNFNYTYSGMSGDAAINIINGDFVLSPDEEVTIEWTPATGFRPTGDDMGLYYPTGGFSMPSAMVDFTQYLSSGNGRESVAVAKGIWSVDDFVSGDAPYIYIGDGSQNGVQFWQGTMTIDDCTDLLISEYGEPNGGNGKYIEIYNSSDVTIDMSDYSIWKISNGGDWPEVELALTGTVLPGATFVVANNAADIPGANQYDTGVINFNGDDAMGLAKNGILIDAVGQNGEDPGDGFDVAGVSEGTKNHVLIRKSTVLAPSADWTVTAGTNTTDSQWEVLDYETTNVGLHSTSCVETTSDADGDGIDDDEDNCVSIANPNQEDLDQDGLGDVCDNDMDGDGVINAADCAPMDAAIYPGSTCDDGNAETVNDVIQNDCSCEGNVPVAPCAELFISEYGEPNGGNGKYIEIYNASNMTVNLSTYSLWKISNGGTWPETYLNLSGTLAPDATYVIANNDTDVPGADLYESFIINFNGDDAMGLAKDSVLIDAVGQDGPDPGSGFDVAGVFQGTKDHTLIRKASVQAPNISWTASSGTDSISSEWLVIPYSQANLGTHTSLCFSFPDMDGDGIADANDNCPNIANPNQEDQDNDTIGDVCDDDIDGDGVNNDVDCDPLDPNVNTVQNSSFTLSAFSCGSGAQVFDVFPTEGGTFIFNPAPNDGAIINSSTGMVSNAIPGVTYSIEYIPNSDCYSQSTQSITMPFDTQAPVFDSIILDENWECDQEIPSLIIPIASDNCDQNPIVEYIDETTFTSCAQIISRTWIATDASGNSTSISQTITIEDTTAPVFDAFDSEVQMSCDNTLSILVTATDNCSEVQISYEETEMPDATCYGQLIRVYTATDECGNSSTATQVIHLIDNIDPEFSNFPNDVILNCGEDIPSVPSVTGIDNCDDSPEIVYNGEIIVGTCPMTITRTWTITDCSGNTVTSEQTISFVDTTAITITSSPADMSIECGEDIPEVLPTATTTLECELVTFTYSDSEETTTCETIITRTFIGEDGCGNLVQVMQIITIVDTTDPVFDEYPLTIDAPCDEIPGVIVTATDNCSSVVIEYTDNFLTGGCAGTINRTYAVIDECGNSSTSQQIINLIDDVSPIFTSFPEDMNLTCGDDVPPVDTLEGEDNCSEVVITYDGEVITGDCPMTIVRTWTITDECGNTATTTQTINFTNTLVPEFTFVPADITIDCDVEIPTESAIATTENPCANIEIEVVDVETSIDCGYIINRTFIATDGCGNTTTAFQIITVIDITPPVVLTTPENLTVQCESDIPLAETPTAIDNCDITLSIELSENITGVCPQTITRTWTITDDCDNTSVTTQVITVNDTTDPEFTSFPENQDLSCYDEVPAAITPEATDNCDDNVTVELTEETSGTCPFGMTVVRTWTATDACGNTISQTQTLTFSSVDAINDLSSANLSISLNPIPASKEIFLTIESLNQDQLEIIIYNALGQKVYETYNSINVGENLILFDITSFENGMYFVKVLGNQSMNTISFIKE